MNARQPPIQPDELPWTTAPEYVSRYANRLQLDERTTRTAHDLARRYGLETGGGGSPRAVAAGALYLAVVLGRGELRQGRIAEVVGVSEISVRKHYRRMAVAEGWVDSESEVEPVKQIVQSAKDDDETNGSYFEPRWTE